MFSNVINKLVEVAINDTHDKLTQITLKILNTFIQLFLGVLIIIYSFQSFLLWSDEKSILTNKIYIKYVEKYINIANDFAIIGYKIFNGLLLFGIILLLVSYFIWLVFETVGKAINTESFFIGDFLIVLSVGLVFWSFVFYILLTVEVQYKKYFIVALPMVILFMVFLNVITKKINAMGRG